MQYIDEYRNPELIRKWIDLINKRSILNINLMEVCGGHTMAIHKFGIKDMLPSHIRLLSGPGCPVCVTDKKFIDQSVAYCRVPDCIIATYGDLIRVPGSTSTLEREKANGADVRIVYSCLDALNLAKAIPEKKIIFLGIGFETTSPSSAYCIKKAYEESIPNFFFFSAHKVMPPALEILAQGNLHIHGYICPGHVSTIIGSNAYQNIAQNYSISCVVSGFEPYDILQSIYLLVNQIEEGVAIVENQYNRAVKTEGNKKALNVLNEVFELSDDCWRGLGVIPNSGLKIKTKYMNINAENAFDVKVEKTKHDNGCICGDILKGQKNPNECVLFNKQCNPDNPVGACMVSFEGACHAFYKYGKIKITNDLF